MIRLHYQKGYRDDSLLVNPCLSSEDPKLGGAAIAIIHSIVRKWWWRAD